MDISNEFFALKQRIIQLSENSGISTEILTELNAFEQKIQLGTNVESDFSLYVEKFSAAKPNLIWVYDIDEHRFASVFSDAATINGYAIAEFKTLSLLDIFTNESAVLFEEFINTVLLEQKNTPYQIKLHQLKVKQQSKAGTQIEAELLLFSRKNASNLHCELVGITKNLQPHISNTTDENHQTDFYLQFIEAMDDCCLFIDKAGAPKYCSKSFEKLVGLKHADLISGKLNYQAIIHPDNYKHVESSVNDSLLQEAGCRLEFRIVMPDKSEKYVDTIVSPYIAETGKFLGLILVLRDITDFKKNEIELIKKQYRLQRINRELERIIEVRTSDLQQKSAHLADSKIQFQNFVNYSAIWETFHDASGRIIYSSNAFEKITGYSVSELLTEKIKIEHLVHPDDLSDFAINYSNALIGEKVDDFEFRIITKNNSVKWVSETIHQIYLDDGTRIGIRSGIKDVSIRKQLQEELFETKGFLENLFNYANVPIIVWQTTGKIIRFNAAFERLTHYSAEEIIGKHIEFLFPEKSKEALAQLQDNPLNTIQLNETELPITCKTGETKIIVWNSAPVYDQSNKNITATIAQGQDITGRIEAEKRVFSAIIEAEERERSNFARELHDGLGPLLSSIKFGYEWLERPGLKTPREEIIKKIAANTDEAIRTVKEISSKLSPYILSNFGLYFAINSYIDKISQIHDTTFHFEANSDKRFNSEFEVSLYRAILECINNAIKHAKAENIYISINHSENVISVEITDDGKGFDLKKVQENPTGLGLFNLSNRIKTLGGNFNIKSEPGKGVHISFILYL